MKLLHQSRRRIPWCPKARKAFVKHCFKYQLNYDNVEWLHLDRLLAEIHCQSTNLLFRLATRHRIQSSLKNTVRKLLVLGIVALNAMTGGIEYPDHLVNSVVNNTWNGDLNHLPEE
ncbi:hypothetical protein F4782DRAFT_535111 [Xylaria castorea]|nr:hypothetical protein F4782DRAFT_535111 [Xylaria castorea]